MFNYSYIGKKQSTQKFGISIAHKTFQKKGEEMGLQIVCEEDERVYEHLEILPIFLEGQ